MFQALAMVSNAYGLKKPMWEIGAGLVSGITPHYLGSNHVYRLTLPVPVGNVRLDFMKMGNENKIYLFNQPEWKLDLAFSGRLPVESDNQSASAPNGADNPYAELNRTRNFTRRGMADLPLTLFVGLEAQYRPNRYLYLSLPVTKGISVGSGFKNTGWLFTPTLILRPLGNASEEESGISLFYYHLYADEVYNELYYGVSSSAELPDRPRFEAKAGLVAKTYGLGGGWYLGQRWLLGAGLAHHDMQSAAVADSPLLVAPQSRTVGVFVRYLFLQSKYLVETH